jgi:hypothetical protein
MIARPSGDPSAPHRRALAYSTAQTRRSEGGARGTRTHNLRIKSPCSDIPVQISTGYRVHLIPFHPDSSPRLYRQTPRHTTPSRAARSPAARHRVPKMRLDRRTIDVIDLPVTAGVFAHAVVSL